MHLKLVIFHPIIFSVVLDTSINRALRINERIWATTIIYELESYNERLNELDSDPSSVLGYTAINIEQFYWGHWALGWKKNRKACVSVQ